MGVTGGEEEEGEGEGRTRAEREVVRRRGEERRV